MCGSVTQCCYFFHHSNSRQQRPPVSILGSSGELTDISHGWGLIQKNYRQLPHEARVRTPQYIPLGCLCWTQKTLDAGACIWARASPRTVLRRTQWGSKLAARVQQQTQLIRTSAQKKTLLNKIFSSYFLVKDLFNLKEKLWVIIKEGWETGKIWAEQDTEL